MKTKTAFTLLYSEIKASIACVGLLDEILGNITVYKIKERKLKRATKKLSAKLKEKVGLHEDVTLDNHEADILQLAIIEVAGYIKVILEDCRQKDEDPSQFQEYFKIMQEAIPDVLWRLITEFGYNEKSLDILEKDFNIKTGIVRPLSLDNTKEVFSLRLNNATIVYYIFIFHLFAILKNIKKESEFAKKLHTYQYVNLDDLENLRRKVKSAILPWNRTLKFTQQNSVALYWMGALSQRMFISDASSFLKDVKYPGGPEKYRNLRHGQFQHFSQLMEFIERKLENDETAKPYLRMVNRWDFL